MGVAHLFSIAAHFSLHQPRTELDALPSDTPIAYQVDDVRASYRITLNRWSVTPSVAFSTYRYAATTIDGTPTSQTYRDRNVIDGSTRAASRGSRRTSTKARRWDW